MAIQQKTAKRGKRTLTPSQKQTGDRSWVRCQMRKDCRVAKQLKCHLLVAREVRDGQRMGKPFKVPKYGKTG